MRRFFTLFALVAVVLLTGASCIQTSGTGSGALGIFRSDDKGDAWVSASAVPTAQGVKSISGVNVFRLHTDPSDPSAIYLASRGQGLMYTYDFGASWQVVSVFNNKFIYGLAVDPKDKCTIYVSDGANIYKTIDCSRTWKLVYTEQRPNQRFVSLAVDYGNSKLIYGGIVGGDVLMSGDAGASWRVVKRFGTELQYLATDPSSPKRLYVATQRNGLFRSDDGGENWTDLSAGLDKFSDSKTFYRLVLNPGQKDSLFWISKYGILRSDDAGQNWEEMKLITPPGSVNIYSFAINPDNQKEIYYTGTILGDKNVHVRSTFYKSIDGGNNWVTKKLPTNTIPAYLLINPQNSSQLLLGFMNLEK